MPEEERARRLQDVSLELVLTAHPTGRRGARSCGAHVRIARLLSRLDDADAHEREGIETTLAEEITLMWQTDEVRHERRRVVDEIRHGLWFFESSLMHVGEQLLAAYRRRLPDAALPFRFGTWIGGDLDGNPAAGPATIADALARARVLALGVYRAEGARSPRRSRRRARSSACRPSSTSRSRATCAICPSTRRRSGGRASSSRTGES